jgi:hypothetical protein
MQLNPRFVLAALGVLVLFTAACVDQPASKARDAKSGAFKNSYLSARTALEDGDYKKAIRGYQSLLVKAGPLEDRIRLEYAHSLLRANRFVDAAREARLISAHQQGDGRLAALAVQGTADHEVAIVALAKGQRDAATKARLAAAKSALDEVLKKSNDFDPLGTLAQRRNSITATLATF